MKVLQAIPEDIPKTAKISCGGCGALLEVEPNDFEFHFEQREGEWFTCACGSCNRTITIDQNKYPFKSKSKNIYVYRGSHSQ